MYKFKKSFIYIALSFSMISMNAMQQPQIEKQSNNATAKTKSKLEEMKTWVKKHPMLTILIMFSTASFMKTAISNVKNLMKKNTPEQEVIIPTPTPLKEILAKMTPEKQAEYIAQAEAEFNKQKEDFLKYLQVNPQNLIDFNTFYKEEVDPTSPAIYAFDYKGYKQVPFRRIHSLIEEEKLIRDEKGNLKLTTKNQSSTSN